MIKIMKTLNNISRAQSVFRAEKLKGVCPSHHSFILAICKNAGKPQEELAKELCLNKSTVARVLTQLEEKGLVKRVANEEDKRQFLVYPSEEMLSLVPAVREISKDFNSLILDGISEEELTVFYSVLSKIEETAKQIAMKSED